MTKEPAEHPQDYDNASTNPLAFFHSPLSLKAQFVLLMQSRFEQTKRWKYRANEEQTGIFVTTEYNLPEEISDETPAIVVGRGTSVWKDTVVGNTGNRNDHRMKHGGESQFSHIDIDIQLRILSPNVGECEVLGDLVQSTIATGKKIIKKNLKLQDISRVTLQPVRKRKGGEYYNFNCSVQFRLTLGQRWFRLPDAPTLRRIKSQFGYTWKDVQDQIHEIIQTKKNLT